MKEKNGMFDSNVCLLLPSQLARPKLKGVELGDIERIVGKDSKQRYAMIREQPPDGSSEDVVYIRANQGHSIQVNQLLHLLVHFTRTCFIQILIMMFAFVGSRTRPCSHH